MGSEQEPEWLARIERHATSIQSTEDAEKFAQTCLFMAGQYRELRAENARLTTETAINKPCVVALEECEAKLKDAVDACISDAVEIGRLKAENARLREGCEHSLIALDGRMPELARRIRDALKGKGT